MYAEDLIPRRSVIDAGSEGKVLKEVVHPLEDAALVVDVLLKSLGALLAEAKELVDVAVLVAAAEKEHLLRVFELEGQ